MWQCKIFNNQLANNIKPQKDNFKDELLFTVETILNIVIEGYRLAKTDKDIELFYQTWNS